MEDQKHPVVAFATNLLDPNQGDGPGVVRPAMGRILFPMDMESMAPACQSPLARQEPKMNALITLRRRMNIDIMNTLLKKSGRGVCPFLECHVPIPRPWMPPWQVLALEIIKDDRPMRSR